MAAAFGRRRLAFFRSPSGFVFELMRADAGAGTKNLSSCLETRLTTCALGAGRRWLFVANAPSNDGFGAKHAARYVPHGSFLRLSPVSATRQLSNYCSPAAKGSSSFDCKPRPWTGWTPLATCGAPQTPNILSNGAEFGCLKDINSLRKTDLPLLPQSAAGAPSPFPKYFQGARESGPLTYVLSSLPDRAIGNRSHVPLLRADTIRRNIIYDRFIGSLRPSPSVGPTPRVSPPSPTSGDPTCLPSKMAQFCWPMGLASFAFAAEVPLTARTGQLIAECARCRLTTAPC